MGCVPEVVDPLPKRLPATSLNQGYRGRTSEETSWRRGYHECEQGRGHEWRRQKTSENKIEKKIPMVMTLEQHAQERGRRKWEEE